MKLAISRLFETSKILSTKEGQALTEFITYMADFAEQVIRAMANGLTISDNLNAKVRTVSLRDQTETVINTDGKTPAEVRLRKIVSGSYALSVPFHWKINSSGQTVVKATFTPTPTTAIDCIVAIEFE